MRAWTLRETILQIQVWPVSSQLPRPLITSIVELLSIYASTIFFYFLYSHHTFLPLTYVITLPANLRLQVKDNTGYL